MKKLSLPLRNFLGLIIIVVLVIGGYYALDSIGKNQIKNAIKNGQIKIDQENHKYRLEKSCVDIDLFIRNTSNYQIENNLVFKITISHQGLESTFLHDFTEYNQSHQVDIALGQLPSKGVLLEDFEATLAVLRFERRNFTLPPDTAYEPVYHAPSLDDYIVFFREYVSLGSGEAVRIEHTQELPGTEIGYLFSIEIDD